MRRIAPRWFVYEGKRLPQHLERHPLEWAQVKEGSQRTRSEIRRYATGYQVWDSWGLLELPLFLDRI